MEHTQQLRSVSHEHHIRCLDRNRLSGDRLFVQLIARHVRRAVRVVVQWHEEAKVCVHARVMQRVVARRVH